MKTECVFFLTKTKKKCVCNENKLRSKTAVKVLKNEQNIKDT